MTALRWRYLNREYATAHDAVAAVWHATVESADPGDAILFELLDLLATNEEQTLRGYVSGLLGAAGGKKGGHARAAALSPERRSEIARAAARARWGPR